MIRCGECGAMITAEEKHQMICSICRYKFSYPNQVKCPRCSMPIEKIPRPTRLHYVYYRCTKMKRTTCSQRSVGIKDLEAQIDAYLAKIQIPERFKEWSVKQLRNLHDKEIRGINSIVQSRQKTYADCLKRLDNLIALKTSPANVDDRLLSDEEYQRQRMGLLKDKSRLEELSQDPGFEANRWRELSEKTFEFACYARKWFAKGDSQAKREIVSAVYSNLTLKDKILSIEAKIPFLILEKSLPALEIEKPILEPENIRFIKGRTGVLSSARLDWRGGRDDVRTSKPIPSFEKDNLLKMVRQIWKYFKNTKEHYHIPSLDRKDSASNQTATGTEPVK